MDTNISDKLYRTWRRITSGYSTNNTLIEQLWLEIEKEYSTNSRQYHSLAHLSYMVSFAESFTSSISNMDVLLFSIFYHDIIYKTSRQDNEEKSAEFAKSRMSKLGVPLDEVTKTYLQIIATKKHETSTDLDTNYLLDFDLAIVGETPKTYRKYTEKIRKEYSRYPDLKKNKFKKKHEKWFF